MALLNVTRDYAAGEILLESDLDAFLDDIETFINVTKLNDDNLQDAGITGSDKLVNASVTNAKMASNSVDTTQLVDGSVTNPKLDPSLDLAITKLEDADGNIVGSKIVHDGSTNRWTVQDIGFTMNLGLKADTTTFGNDSITITSADHTALSATNVGYVTMEDTTSGQLTTFAVTADVTIELTGAHWGFNTNGDLNDVPLHVIAINDNGTLEWGIAFNPHRKLATANATITPSGVVQIDDVLVTSVPAAERPTQHIGWIKSDFDDTGGAAENLWTVGVGVADVQITAGDVPMFTKWIAGPALTIGAITSAPSKATNVIIDQIFWRREGDSLHLRYLYEHSDNTGTGAGSGIYLWTLPFGLSADTSKFFNRFSSFPNDGCRNVVGSAGASFDSPRSVGFAKLYTATQIMMITADPATVTGVGSTHFAINQARVEYSFDCVVPIDGWEFTA